MKAHTLLLTTLLAAMSTLRLSAQAPLKFALADVSADLDTCYRTLQASTYTNLYASTPKSVYDAEYHRIKNELGERKDS